jgi:glycosyltransferase involved in cell wall biosynthesis
MRNLLTIITPVYNAERYLEEVIVSVLSQGVNDLKYIIVDDGSTDRSLEIAQDYAERFSDIIKVVSQPNSGEADAVNLGFALADSKYVMVVNADDPLLPEHCQKIVKVLQHKPRIVAAYPDWIMIDSSNEKIRNVKTIEFSRRALIADLVCIPGPGTIFVSDAVKASTIRDPRFKYVSDYVFWLGLSSSGDFMRVPEVLATWRQHEHGATATGGTGMTDELLRVAEIHLDELTNQKISTRWKKSALSKAHYYAAVNSLNGQRTGGLHHLLKSFVYKPWRNFGYETHHRSIKVGIAVLLGPLGRFLARKLR